MNEKYLTLEDNDLMHVDGGEYAAATRVAIGVLCFAGGFGVGCIVVLAAIAVYQAAK